MRIDKPLLLLLFFLIAPVAQADLARAQNLFEQGRTKESLVEVDRLLAQSPNDAETRFLKGIIFADMGRSQEAIEVFAGLTQDFPELPEPYNNLAVLFAEQGEFEKARDSLMAAIQTHPSYSTAHENLGDLYAKMAGIAYDRALEEDRANQSARLKLSAVNGLFSAPRAMDQSQPVQVAQATPAPAPVVVATAEPVAQEPEIIQSEPIPEPVKPTPAPVVAQAEPEPEPVTVAAATVTEPAPTPAPSSTSAADDIRNTIRAWATAWANKDVDGYIDTYAQTFKPSNGAPRATWVTYRRDRLSNPSFIQIDVGDIEVQMLGANRARATFLQGYKSNTYQDRVVKTLTMSRTSSGWQITSEDSEAV